MTVPAIVNDGNFSQILQNGSPETTFPFFNLGDDKTFIARVRMRVRAGSFVMPKLMSQRFLANLGQCYLVDVEDGTPVDNTDLIEYVFVYAAVPQTRTEYGSATYTYQAVLNGVTTNFKYTDVFPASIVFEYSVFTPLPPLFRGRLLTSATDTGAVTIQAGRWVPSNTQGLLLAENSTSGIWLGKIYFRRSVYVSTPPVGVFQPA